MEKEFTSYEEALALKELGFDEDCFGYYVNAELDLTWKFSDCSLYQDTHISILAPLYQQAFRWFREKYSLLCRISYKSGKYKFEYQYISSANNLYMSEYETYEEAELECLKKLIEICSKLK